MSDSLIRCFPLINWNNRELHSLCSPVPIPLDLRKLSPRDAHLSQEPGTAWRHASPFGNEALASMATAGLETLRFRNKGYVHFLRKDTSVQPSRTLHGDEQRGAVEQHRLPLRCMPRPMKSRQRKREVLSSLSLQLQPARDGTHGNQRPLGVAPPILRAIPPRLRSLPKPEKLVELRRENLSELPPKRSPETLQRLGNASRD